MNQAEHLGTGGFGDAMHTDHEGAIEKMGESIFHGHKDWKFNAFLYTSWDLYAIGYKKAADSLIRSAVQYSEQDFVVYPVMFLYRHYLELRLKELLLALQEYYGVPRGIPHHHDILKLWKSARVLIAQVYNSEAERQEATEALDNIEKRVLDFHMIDKGSFSFRYPVDKENISSLGRMPAEDGQIVISLVQVRDIMDAVAYFLDGLSMGISSELDYRKEIEQEYIREVQEDYNYYNQP